MRIRRAAPADLPTLVELAAALFAEDGGTRDDAVDVGWPARDGRPYYGALLSDAHALVVVAGSPAVGFLIGRLSPPDPLRPAVGNAELESMFVRPGARSSGIGRALVEHFLHWAGDHGANRSTVTAYASNAAAVRFYRSLGYHEHQVMLSR